MVPPIPLGSLLRQRYLIQAILGQGGFGRTYLAVDQERFDERCVLKEFSVPYQDEELIKKSQILFQREASTLYQIQHPQIPRFWAAFEETQRLFLVQDFVDGSTYRHLLNERRQQGRVFSEDEVRFFLRNMLPVLAYIHDRGIVHRDISPENIILRPASDPQKTQGQRSERGIPVLIDFGAVKEATTHWPLTSMVTRVGKVGYAPPEQLQTGQVYPNSDLYSLAATCLALLTGKEPRSLVDSQTLAWQWRSHAELSHPFAAILERMLSVYPGDRYQSAQEVSAELDLLTDISQESDGAVAAGVDSHPMQPPILPGALLATAINSSVEPVHHRQAAELPRPSKITASQSETMVRSHLTQKTNNGLKVAMAVAFLLGVGVSGSVFWKVWTSSSSPNGEVWVSGTKIPQSEASRIIGSQQINSANSTIQSPNLVPDQGNANNPVASSSQVEKIQFPPGKIATTLQGDLQERGLHAYILNADQGQILTATVEGAGVVMNLLRANQEGIDSAAYQTRSWTGQLPNREQYLIQVSGSGPYTLDVAVTPTSRPTQETTERVAFARGSNGTTVTGNLAPKQIRRYLLKAQQGQLVLAKVLQGKVSLIAIAPDGERIGGTAANAKEWKGRLPADGDYVIEVSAAQPTDYALSFEIF